MYRSHYQPLAQILALREMCFLFYLNNFHSQTLRHNQRHNHTVLHRAALSGPERALDRARWGGSQGRVFSIWHESEGVGNTVMMQKINYSSEQALVEPIAATESLPPG
jgi:hypothetical protein